MESLTASVRRTARYCFENTATWRRSHAAVCPEQKFWPGTRVARELSAKELFGSSILPQALKAKFYTGQAKPLKCDFYPVYSKRSEKIYGAGRGLIENSKINPPAGGQKSKLQP